MKHNDWLFGEVTLEPSQVRAMTVLVMTAVHSVHWPDVIEEISYSKPGICFWQEVWRTKEVASAGPGTDNTTCHTRQQRLHHRDGSETMLLISTSQVTARYCTGLQGMANTLLLSSSYWNEQQWYMKLCLSIRACRRSRGSPLIILNLSSRWTANTLQSVSHVVSLTTAPLQCTQPASAATFSDSCCAEGNDKTNTLYCKYLMPLMAIYCQADHTPQTRTNFFFILVINQLDAQNFVLQ